MKIVDFIAHYFIRYFFLLFGIGLLSGALNSTWNTLSLIFNGVTAQGRVVDLHVSTMESRSRSDLGYNSSWVTSYLYHPIVEFTDQSGKSVSFVSPMNFGEKSFSSGDQVEIVYPPNNPEEAWINNTRSFWLWPFVFLIFGGFSFGIGLLLFHATGPRKRRSHKRKKIDKFHISLWIICHEWKVIFCL